MPPDGAVRVTVNGQKSRMLLLGDGSSIPVFNNAAAQQFGFKPAWISLSIRFAGRPWGPLQRRASRRKPGRCTHWRHTPSADPVRRRTAGPHACLCPAAQDQAVRTQARGHPRFRLRLDREDTGRRRRPLKRSWPSVRRKIRTTGRYTLLRGAGRLLVDHNSTTSGSKSSSLAWHDLPPADTVPARKSRPVCDEKSLSRERPRLSRKG